MFRSKVDIDRHVNEIFRKCSSSEQRSLESLKIANLYHKIKEYEQGKMFTQQYLTVKPNDAAAHEMLGLCHEGLHNKVKAFEEFKLTLSLNLNNKNVLKKLALLAVDDDVPLDLIKDKYWIERVEQYLATLPAERFKLKEKLVKMSRGNQSYQKQYEELLLAELDSNPQSLDIHLKILKQYKTPERIVDAYKFATNTCASKKNWKQAHVWYREVVDVCKMYEQSGLSLPSKEKTKFYETYVLNVEKEIKFGLHEKGWKLTDFVNSLTLFDQVLYKLRASIPNFDQSGGSGDKLIVQHYAGQLCFYTLLLLLKKAKTDTQGNPALFREKLSSCSPLLLLALNPGLVLEFEPKYHGGDSGAADSVKDMKAETNYRLSQCHLFLGLLKKFGILSDDIIASACQSKDWANSILATVIPAGAGDQQQSYAKRFLTQQKPSSDLAVLTGNQLCRPEYISGTELSQPCSLHHMVWLGVTLMLEAGTILPPASFRAGRVAPHLQFSARNIHLTHMNLCVLDVDAFLYASVFCALSGLQYRQGQGQEVNGLPLLLADLTPSDLLISPEQSHWWAQVHSLLLNQSEGGGVITAVAKDREILNGVSLVRNVAQHSLHVSLLVALARMFAVRASELGATSGPKDQIRALESRSQHYWECALPPLQRLEKNKNISGVSDTLFRYHGEPITSIEASAIIEEAKCTLGCFLLNNNKLSEASNTFKPLKSAFAKYNLAKIYVKLGEDELVRSGASSNSPFDNSSSVLNSSLLSALNGEARDSPSGFSYKYSIFLNKAKECLITAQARLDSELASPSYYPDLSHRILDLLTEVETKLETADGTWDDRNSSHMNNSSLNNSTFAAASTTHTSSHHQPHRVERASDYASPIQKQHRNLQHNSSRLYFSPEPSSNVNSLYISNQATAAGLASNKALETQIELILERLKRLTEQFERVEHSNASGSSQGNQQEVSRSLNALNDRLDAMTGQLNEMHDKYLSVLESIKDLVTDKTDVIQNLTENLNTLSSKVNVLMAQEDLDEHFLLNTEDYPEINPSFYSGPSSSQVNKPATGPYYGGAAPASGGLMFSEGQSLPNFYGQQILPPGPSGVLAPPVGPAGPLVPPVGIQPGLAPIMPASPLAQLSMMAPPPAAAATVPAPTTFNVDVKKTPTIPQQAPPHNVVITTSDRLPTGPPTSTPALSVCIPPQHLLANKPKFGANPTTTTSSSSSAAPQATAAGSSVVGGPTPGGVIPGPPNLFGQLPGGPVPAPATAGFGVLASVQPPPWLQPASTPGSAPLFGTGTPGAPLFGSISSTQPFGSTSSTTSAAPPTSSSFLGGAPLFGQVPAVHNAFSSPAKPFAVPPPAGGGPGAGLTFDSPGQQSVGGAGFASPAAVKGFASPAALSSGSFLSSPLSSSGPLNSTPVKGSPSQGALPGSGPTTPHNFQIQMPGGQLDAMKKQLETSPLIRESLEQAESDDDEVTEHDPMPDFKPIIPLPDEVEVETGEENETVLFERRAKLYRYVGKEWKERGIGAVKVLKHKDSGKVRLLMRREVVHKVCANHFLHADMELKPMTNSDKAYIWFAQDYADEVVSEDQLCLRFKTKEDAEEFKTVFNEHKGDNTGSSPASKPGPGKTETKQIGFSKELTQVKAGSWECKQCYVMNAGGDKCVACNSVNPAAAASTPNSVKPGAAAASTPAAAPGQYQFGGLTFSSTPVLKEETEKSKAKTESSVAVAATGTSTTGSTPFSSFSFTTLSTSSTLPTGGGVNPFASLNKPTAATAAPAGAFSFGTSSITTPSNATPATPSGKDAGGAFPTLKTLLSTPNAASGGVDFASLAKSATSGSPFSSSPAGTGAKPFQGAGTPLFGNKFTANPATPGEDTKDDGAADEESGVAGGNPDDDFVPTAEFKPVIPMPDLVTVITGEENSTTLWECRSKLLRFEPEAKEWKERGLGVMKLLRDETSQAVRLVMRREQVHKVCCNQRISAGFELKPLATSDKAWTWYGIDYSEGETKNELFALRFKTSEQADEFKAKIEQVVAELKANPSPVKQTSTAGEQKKPSSGDNKPSLSSLFKPKAGSWECQGCFVRNAADLTTCPACNTVKPGTTGPGQQTAGEDKTVAAPPAPRFSFGVPKNDDDSPAVPQVAVPQFKPATNLVSSAFSFGIPAASAPPPAAPASSTTSVSSSFSFGSSNPGIGGFGSKPSESNVFGSSSEVLGFQNRFGESNPDSIWSGVKPSESIPVSSGVVSTGSSSFQFGMKSGGADQETPEKSPLMFGGQSETENNAFRFGSSKFSFSGLKHQPTSPGGGNKSGYRTESESEADTTYEEEEDHIHFQPIIPLPDKVEITTGEENETILYQHRAKLFRFVETEWKERGVGDVKLLSHNETGKLRFIMRREPIEKICLNHYVDSSLHITAKDDKTWLWAALDFAEGEWTREQFALRFKTPEIAIEFKRAVDEALHSEAGGPSTPSSKRQYSSEDVQIVYEKTPDLTEEEKMLTKKYSLPPLFFEYKNKTPCPGCKGCEDEDEGTEAPVSTSVFTAPAAPVSLSKGGLTSRLLAPPKQSSTPNESVSTPTGTSFGSASSPIVKPVELTSPSNDSLSTLDSEKASATMGNIFTTGSLTDNSQTHTPSSLPPGSLFGSAQSSGAPLFGSANSGKSSVVFGQSSGSFFGSAKDSSSVFGQTTSSGGLFGASPAGTGGSSNLFSTNNITSGGNTPLFGGGAKKKTSPSQFGVNVGDLFSGGGAGGEPPVTSSDSGTGTMAKTTGPFGGTTNLFGGSGDKKQSLFGVSGAGDDKKSLFGGVGGASEPSTFGAPNSSLFGSSAKGTTNLFGGNAAGSFFGPKSSDGTTGAGLFSGGGAPTQSIFGAAIQPVFGTKQPLSGGTGADSAAPSSALAAAPAGDTSLATSTPPATTNAAATPGLTSTPSFLDKVDAAPSFATLASGTSSEVKPFSSKKGGKITWEGAGSSVFTSTPPAAGGNTSTTGQDEEEEGDEGADGEGGEHDPHFEPIIPLPDIVEVKTGEEDEMKLYGERCKLYRYDKETKEWKERGVGELKLLHHPDKQTYRLLMRREQIHKTVVNFLLWPGFELKPLASSDKAWVMTAMNLAEDYPAPESEELAVRFKNCDLANEFKSTLDDAVKKVQEIKANSSQHDTSSISAGGAGANEEEVEDEEEYEVVEEEEEEDVDEEELDEEDEIDFEAIMNMSTLIEHPVTLLKRANSQSKWKTIGNGSAKIDYDEHTAGYKVSVVDTSEEITLDTHLTDDTTLESKGKAIVWRGTDLSSGYPADSQEDFMLKFSSDDHVETFLQFMDEGVTMAKDALDVNVED
uniref:E3 SUMO-protein ligase RanBP2 n=1 Tax=Cacopsylla melanoneura TaxID=428564 RepID=A0A8D9BSU6_9HEMI